MKEVLIALILPFVFALWMFSKMPRKHRPGDRFRLLLSAFLGLWLITGCESTYERCPTKGCKCRNCHCEECECRLCCNGEKA